MKRLMGRILFIIALIGGTAGIVYFVCIPIADIVEAVEAGFLTVREIAIAVFKIFIVMPVVKDIVLMLANCGFDLMDSID